MLDKKSNKMTKSMTCAGWSSFLMNLILNVVCQIKVYFSIILNQSSSKRKIKAISHHNILEWPFKATYYLKGALYMWLEKLLTNFQVHWSSIGKFSKFFHSRTDCSCYDFHKSFNQKSKYLQYKTLQISFINLLNTLIHPQLTTIFYNPFYSIPISIHWRPTIICLKSQSRTLRMNVTPKYESILGTTHKTLISVSLFVSVCRYRMKRRKKVTTIDRGISIKFYNNSKYSKDEVCPNPYTREDRMSWNAIIIIIIL